jgi:hypothetical protein
MFSSGAAQSVFSVDTLVQLDEKERKKRNRVAKYFLNLVERNIEREYTKYNDSLIYQIPRFTGHLPFYDTEIVSIKVCKALQKHKNLNIKWYAPDAIQISWIPRQRSKQYLNEILHQIETQILFEYKRDPTIRKIQYQIPHVTKCLVYYNISEAAKLLIERLKRLGFSCEFKAPNHLIISWSLTLTSLSQSSKIVQNKRDLDTTQRFLNEQRYRDFANVRYTR